MLSHLKNKNKQTNALISTLARSRLQIPCTGRNPGCLLLGYNLAWVQSCVLSWAQCWMLDACLATILDACLVQWDRVKNHGSVVALLSGKFLQIRKVFATRHIFAKKCPVGKETVGMVRKLSGQSTPYPDNLETVRTI